MGIQGPGEGYYELIGGVALGASMVVALAIALPFILRRRRRAPLLAGVIVVYALLIGTYAWVVSRDDAHPLEDDLRTSTQELTSSYDLLDGVELSGADPQWISTGCEVDPDGGYLFRRGQVDRRIDIDTLAPQLERDGFTTAWTRNIDGAINGLEARRGEAGLTVRVFTNYSSLHFQYGPCIPTS